jgi:hypothetical protein
MKIRYVLAGALLAYATMIGGSAYAADLIADHEIGAGGARSRQDPALASPASLPQ